MPSNWIRPLTAAPCVRRLPVWASWVTRWTSRRSNGAARPNCNLRNYKQRLYGVVFTHPPGFLPRYGEGLCFFGGLHHVNYRRSEEHTSELQSLMRISYAVFCLKKKKTQNEHNIYNKHITHTTFTKTYT